MKKAIILMIIVILMSSLAIAHSLYLFNISLDFDKNMKENVIKTAQDFAKTKKIPSAFDLDKGLIVVRFDDDSGSYVRINPADFKVYGMQNENLRHKEGAKKFDKQYGLEIARKLFDTFPKEITSELAYDEEVSEVDGTYFYKWFRFKDGILIAGDDLFINFDAVNGNIIGYRIPIFYVNKENINTNPAITMNIAKRVGEISLNSPAANNFEPYLISYNGKLIWTFKLQGQFYPFYAGVDASDGSIDFSGLLPGEIPLGYNKGKDVQVIETEIIKNIYASK